MKRRIGNFIGASVCYLIYLLSGVAASFVIAIYYSAFKGVDNGYGGAGNRFLDYAEAVAFKETTLVLLVSYAIVLGLILLYFGKKRKSVSAFTGLSYAYVGSLAGAFFVGVGLNFIVHIFAPCAANGEEEITKTLFLCITIGAFIEEMVFRGILLKMFGNSCGIVCACVITSVLFSLAHSDPVQMSYTFVLGLVLSVTRVKSTSLWSCVAMHLSFNVTGVVLSATKLSFGNREIILLFIAEVLALILACSGGRRLKTNRRG